MVAGISCRSSQALCQTAAATFSKVPRKILGKLLILLLLLLLLLLLHSFLLLHWTELIGLLVQCSTVALYPLDDVATCVSVAPKIRSFPKIFLGTFENAAPGQLTDMPDCRMDNLLKVKSSCGQVEWHSCHHIYWRPPATSFQLCQQHVFDAHDVETHESLHQSLECVSCLVSESTFYAGELACQRHCSSQPSCQPLLGWKQHHQQLASFFIQFPDSWWKRCCFLCHPSSVSIIKEVI